MLFNAILALYVITYVAPLLYLSLKWWKEPIYSIAESCPHISDLLSISVVIAVRDEEANIKKLIEILSLQTLPQGAFEVIIVDDNSSDRTLQILEHAESQHGWLRVIKQEKGLAGKKAALKLGINAAKAELIAFTDGDCTPAITWLETLWSFYLERKKPDMVIGLVDMCYKDSLQGVFRFEFLSMLSVSSAMAAVNNPVLCNGANMAVKKNIALAADLNNQIVSGDDVFLLHYIKEMGGTIRVLKSNHHKVLTSAPDNFLAFIKQRIRWGSKAKYYTDKTTISLTASVMFANIILLIALINLLIYKEYFPFMIILATKLIADFTIINAAPKILKPGKILLFFPILEIVYSIYLISTALLSIKSPFGWKGRKYYN